MTTTFRSPQEEAQYRAHFQHFDRDAHVVVDGTRYAWSEEDFHELALAGQYHPFAPDDLNSSVYARIASMGRAKFSPRLRSAQIIALCAAALKTTEEKLEQGLWWTANYMAFHDGGDPDLELMSHRNPGNDLAVVVERALDLLLRKLESERLGKTTRPTRPAAPRVRGVHGDIPRAVRREVFERDGETCTFVASDGRRCTRGRFSSSNTSSRARWADQATPRTSACAAERTIACTRRRPAERSTSRASSTLPCAAS
ncbi:hypothetical protein BH11MYX4_BH11MYX4_20290 [soil metagenome]